MGHDFGSSLCKQHVSKAADVSRRATVPQGKFLLHKLLHKTWHIGEQMLISILIRLFDGMENGNHIMFGI